MRRDALLALGGRDWPRHRRRALLMLLVHAALDPSPEVRFAALDALSALAFRHPRVAPRVEDVLQRWSRSACRATALHAMRLLAARADAMAGGACE